ncbi:hypothetical protein NX794_06600 [Streptomyces sp. LP11]|uniref:Lipoprotein n=1 Tax=Streptomyces pyxinicus TaxID=2970331 RepID=A0ABT2AYD4_9ACTN|nr:hypothetical protein [Streptomyces sp. LP11]MCS0600900.1 hypothetical protein [Streptomyces sp. LP11]
MATLATLLAALTACGGGGSTGSAGSTGTDDAPGADGRRHTAHPAPGPSTADPTRVPGVGDRLLRRIPASSRQVVAVYGEGKNSSDSTVVLYTRTGTDWHRVAGWPAHNGRHGWTTHHHVDDGRSPVGVFTLSDAGGRLRDPGARLPYRQDPAYAPPAEWDAAHQHDFDYVIAIDYNRIRGTSPLDPTRPQGEAKGGGIWLHLDHHSGTSACVSVSEKAMEFLLRTLDPSRHPVIVMGDRAALSAGRPTV